jgi:hypothetical protein
MKSTIKLTEADVQNCVWTFSHFDGPYRVSIGRGLNKFFSEIAAKKTEGDKDHLKWWLNRPENLPFRTRDGKL